MPFHKAFSRHDAPLLPSPAIRRRSGSAAYRGATVDAISKFKQSVRPGGQGKSLMSVDAVCRYLSIPP